MSNKQINIYKSGWVNKNFRSPFIRVIKKLHKNSEKIILTYPCLTIDHKLS